ncbi:MAG: hemolysin family protein [Planctomycetota bacterium]|nr:hemolysin family protein [Planctomycetota bacterium]
MSAIIVISLIVLFMGTAFTSLAELSISSVNPLRIKHLAEQGRLSARAVMKIRARPDLLFGSLLISNTIVNVIIPILFVKLIADIFTGSSAAAKDTLVVVISSAFITVLEVFAKTLGTARSEKMALFTAIPVLVIIKVTYIPVLMVNTLSNAMNRIIGVRPGFEDEGATLDDVRLAIRSAAEGGYVKTDEEKMMRRLSHIGELSANDIMIPRTEMVAFPEHLSCIEAAQKVVMLPYSRYPVYSKNLDDIVGILHSRDLLACQELNSMIILHDILYPPVFVPETAPVQKVLSTIRQERTHMIIVVDEFGNPVGLITLEDILEEIVGDIMDEFDREVPEVTRQSDGTLVAHGKVSLRYLKEEYKVNLSSKSKSLGGLILRHAGGLPEVGQEFRHGSYKMKVLEMNGKRIGKVSLEKTEEDESVRAAVERDIIHETKIERSDL